MFKMKADTSKSNLKQIESLMNRVNSIKDYEVQYGYFEGDIHQESGLDIAQLAEMLNFGTDSIIARPFMELAGDMVERHFEVSNQWKKDTWNYLRGQGTIITLLKSFGRVGEVSVQGSIDTGDWAENAEWWKTVKFERYGSSAPLVASQELYDSVKSKVVKVNK